MSRLEELMKQRPIKNEFKLKNEENGPAKVFLYGTVGGYYDGFSLRTIQNALKEIDSDEIELHINSYGGDLFEGIAIKNLLRSRDEKITIYIDGIAASAASIVAMAGNEIIMPSDSQLMIHNPWTVAFGNAKELHKVADDLEKMQSSLEKTYIDRFVGTEDELRKLLDEETYLTAEECVVFGLADKIDSEENDNQADDEISAKDTLIQRIAAEKLKKPAADIKKENKGNDLLKNLIKVMEEK